MSFYKSCDCDWCLAQRWNNKPLLEKLWIKYEIWFNLYINKIRTDWKDYVYSEYLKENKK